jgi:glycine cleavage system H protein
MRSNRSARFCSARWVSRIRRFRIEVMSYPATYRYTKEHEWIEATGTEATVGITDYAQHLLGDIVFVDLPKIGAELAQKDSFGSVESVKAVSDVYAPVAGTVTAINEALTSAPETINSDANTTWLIKVTLSDPAQLEGLLDAAAYEKFVSEETGK